MNGKYIYLIVTSLVFFSCLPQTYDSEGIPKPVIDSQDDPKSCQDGCSNLSKLGCDEGKDLVYPQECDSDSECAYGTCIEKHCTETCVDFCEETIKAGRFMGPGCWSTISACKEINQCSLD